MTSRAEAYSETQAVRMKLSEVESLEQLRLQNGISICVQQETLWVHFRKACETLENAIRTLPGTRFSVLPDRQLVKFQRHVPHGYLPDEPWTDLARWMDLHTDPAALAGIAGGKVALKFERGGPLDIANVLVTDAATWLKYATNASRIRLERCAMAINGDRQVVVWGTPAPPLPGERFVERLGVAVAAGWTWTPPVDHAVLAELLSMEHGDLALLRAGGMWEHLRADAFVRATRSAVRLSLEVGTDE